MHNTRHKGTHVNARYFNQGRGSPPGSPRQSDGLPHVITAGGEITVAATTTQNQVGFGFTAAAILLSTLLSMYEDRYIGHSAVDR